MSMTFGGAGLAQNADTPAGKKTTIFDYKDELKLTDAQERGIRQLLADFNKTLQLERARLTIVTFEIEDLVKKEADLEQIRDALNREAMLRASITYNDLAASRQINAVLSPQQLQKWREIQNAVRAK